MSQITAERRAYNRQYYQKNREKLKAQTREYRKNNLEKLTKRERAFHKTRINKFDYRVKTWMGQGIKSQEWENVFQRYTSTMMCDCCGVDFEGKGKFKKSLDHDHLSGEVRNIICHDCNVKRSPIDRHRMKLNLEIHRYFLLKNP